jgi:hypothetical protein
VELSKEIMPVFHILLTLSRLSKLMGAGAILTRTGSKKNAFANKIANDCPSGKLPHVILSPSARPVGEEFD